MSRTDVRVLCGHGEETTRVAPAFDVRHARGLDARIAARAGRPSALLDTRVVYCGDNLEQLAKLPDASVCDRCVDGVYIDPPFNTNRNYEVFWGETKEKRAFEDRHASTQAYIEYISRFRHPVSGTQIQFVKRLFDGLTITTPMFTSAMTVTPHSQLVQDPLRANIANIRRRPKAEQVKGLRSPLNDRSRRLCRDPLTPPSTPNCVSEHRTSRVGINFQIYRPDHPVGKHHRERRRVIPRFRSVDLDELLRVTPKKRLRDVREKLGEVGIIPVLQRVIDVFRPEWPKYESLRSKDLFGDHQRLPYSTRNPRALDAFCGWGTALVAAQNLGRQWIGLDISPTACRVMAKRLRDVCRMKESEPRHAARQPDAFIVRDLPWTVEKLRALPHFEFENWAVIALGGIPNKVQVGDMGVDGRIFPVGTGKGKIGPTDTGGLYSEDWFPIQVKQVDKVGRPDIDAFEAVMEREGEGGRQRGFFVSFGYTRDAEQECAAFYKRTGRVIKLLTVQEILDEEHVQKM